MTVVEKAVQWAINTAQDNSHGYSQANRWGPDYDCSSFVITAYEQAGVPVREAGASYTGNMRSAFISCGFADVTTQCGLSSGYGIQAGDVLLNYSAHTCISIGDGKVANCRTDEGHPQSGDQSGNEIRIQTYWNFPWNCVLRYKGKEKSDANQGSQTAEKPKESVKEDHSWTPQTLRQSNVFKPECVVLQALLNVKDFPCGTADGIYGPKTASAVARAQHYYGLEADCICGPKTWAKLLETG